MDLRPISVLRFWISEGLTQALQRHPARLSGAFLGGALSSVARFAARPLRGAGEARPVASAVLAPSRPTGNRQPRLLLFIGWSNNHFNKTYIS